MAKYRGKLKDASGNEMYPQPDGYYPGDVLELGDCVICGYTTSGASICLFTIPINKPIYATAVSLSNIKMEARISPSGYLYDGTTPIGGNGKVSIATERFTYHAVFPSGIRCTYTAANSFKNSAGSIYNNGPVPILINATLTFS